MEGAGRGEAGTGRGGGGSICWRGGGGGVPWHAAVLSFPAWLCPPSPVQATRPLWMRNELSTFRLQVGLGLVGWIPRPPLLRPAPLFLRCPHALGPPPRAAEATRCLKNGVLVENDEGAVARYLEQHPELAARIGTRA